MGGNERIRQMSSQKNTSGGIGFLGLLSIAFIILKLTGYINWSWLWVLSPIWGSCLFGIGILLLFIVILSFVE